MQMIPIDVKEKDFEKLMHIYEGAMMQVKQELESMQNTLKKFYEYDVINNINCRIKSPESIVNKMKKKNYDLNYKALIQNINDVAGIRIVCPFRSDIVIVRKLIEESEVINIIEEKDYIKKPKKSGYTGIHYIVSTPVTLGETNIQVKMEIQIRTMAMDFWATAEHKIKYKSKSKLSAIDSRKMVYYSKLINQIDEKIMNINNKYID